MPLQNRNILHILTLLLLVSFSFAQQSRTSGYLALPDTSIWQAEVDRTRLNSTGSLFVELQAGTHSLKLIPKNRRNWLAAARYFKIDIVSAETLFVDLSSEISKHPGPGRAGMQHNIYGVKSTRKLGLNERRQLKRFVKPGIIVSAIAANWASFYLKRKADDYYEQYQKTSNLSKMKHYYNKAESFDIYSSIMLGVSVSALSTYFYLILTD